MNVYDLARRFARQLAETVTPEQLDEINIRNAAEINENVCHSHDFCDANQVMLDAFAEFDDSNEDHGWQFQLAWAIARDNEFSESLIDGDESSIKPRT